MLRKCTVLVAVLVAVQSASFQGRRSIPVEVRYERLEHNFLSNLSEKVQLSPEELQENQLRLEKLKAAEQEELAKKDHSNSIKNLNEKVQLSPEELLQASKHIPIHNSLRTNQDISDLERLGELRNEPVSKIEQLQSIIETGLENLRKNFQPKKNDIAPSKEEWERLETEVRDYFTEEKNKLAKQESGSPSQTGFQGWTIWLQNATTNFLGNFQQQNGTSGDEGTSQGPFQNFIGYFTGGVENIVSTIQGQNSQSGNTTVLGDNENGGPSNIFGNFLSGAQQFIQGTGQQFVQAIGQNSSQGDEGTGSQGGIPFQNVVQSIGSAVSQIVQGGQRPQGSEDENTSQGPGTVFLQQVQAFGQNIGSAFQNLQNQFAPSANKPASGAAVTETPSKQSEDSGEKEESTEKTATEAEKNEEMTATE